MRERPILFSGTMVRAILAGQKTQTRRVLKQATGPSLSVSIEDEPGVAELSWLYGDGPGHEVHETVKKVACPYGRPGDRLWVREATIKVEDHGYEGPVFVESDEGRACLEGGLAPDPDDCVEVEPYELRIRPSIHMPRAYSRITLEIVSVRVQRLNDISEADAFAEGIQRLENHSWGAGPAKPLGTYRGLDEWSEKEGFWTDAVSAYAALWESINGPGSWAANPWVWVVEFRRITQ